jgi:Holliday junction resolvasome RuvABC endonuclease subunit
LGNKRGKLDFVYSGINKEIKVMTKFEENNPEQLKEFLLKLQYLYDEYHPNLYTIDQVYEGVQMITDAIRKQLEK